jgi:hypothetical protein
MFSFCVIMGVWILSSRVAVNALSKQSRIADKGWSSGPEVGRGADKSPLQNASSLQNVTQVLCWAHLNTVMNVRVT